MCLRPASVLTLFLILAVLISSATGAEIILSGHEIPARLTTGSLHIFSNSDSLFLDGRLLERGVDYQFLTGEGYFDLSHMSFSDSSLLRVVYQPLPPWLMRSYGRPLPEVGAVGSTTATPGETESPLAGRDRAGSKIAFSGAKGFRFSTRSAGASQFSQSLDLNISGELADGVEISGTVSDRGFDPTYGTLNARLNELDRLNLTVSSRRLTAQIGDIQVTGPQPQDRQKSVSGASFGLHYPGWHLEGAAARPHGRFASFEFYGQDGFQGPYQIGAGRKALPIVPGSESIWLDGRALERGTNKDYSIDYPTGRVTFNVNHPIDQRSRIEVDYEPLTTDYKEELFAISGGAQLTDSIFYLSVGYLREGDDKGQPLAGDLSEFDQALLERAGDGTAIRSGVAADSTGSYRLLADSLPDSVFQYVGVGNGSYRLVFSYVGAGNGDYRFLGDDNYQFAGSNRGDYIPIIIIPAAERTAYYQTILGTHHDLLGDLRFDLRSSDYDRNLHSSLDEGDNLGYFYGLSARKEWRIRDQLSSISAQRRFREKEFNPRERINKIDFNRDFFLPFGIGPSADETLHDIRVTSELSSALSVSGFYANLDYRSLFDSRRGGAQVDFKPDSLWRISGEWQSISARLSDSDRVKKGYGDNYRLAVNFEPTSTAQLSTEYERDSRENHYTGDLRGTRFEQLRLRMRHQQESVQYELFVEDTLDSDWRETLTRHRITLFSTRRWGALSYDATSSFQWLQRPSGDESNTLNRLDFRYNDPFRQLSIITTYAISEEQRNAQGIAYLEVEPGQGDYSLENGQYLPDPDGDFIQVEEILSANARVRRGEKSFNLNKTWSSAQLRFTSRIAEELLDAGRRRAWWLIPFISDENQPYQFYDTRHEVDLRLLRWRGFHIVNIKASRELEKREVASNVRSRRNRRAELSFKQAVADTYLEEGVEFFEVARDNYYSGAGNVDGFRIRLSAHQTVGEGDVNLGGSFRRADDANGENSRQFAIQSGVRWPVAGNGELRLNSELYRQLFSDLVSVPSYQLTDNRFGERGASWSVAFSYGVKKGTRLNLDLNGRHANNRTARITARVDMVAGF